MRSGSRKPSHCSVSSSLLATMWRRSLWHGNWLLQVSRSTCLLDSSLLLREQMLHIVLVAYETMRLRAP